jgi:hypothetical protein
MSRHFATLVVAVLLLAGGCDRRSEYERLVARELSKGVAHDTLFLGYELGMPRAAFYDHSWALNRKGLVMQGPQNQTVQYELDDELPHSAKMYYYPDFADDKIVQMRVRFQYDGWAPWNRHLFADSLQLDVVALLERWYGEGFIQVETEDRMRGRRHEYIKVDGNRRIVVAQASDRDVMAVFTDLTAAKAIQEPTE